MTFDHSCFTFHLVCPFLMWDEIRDQVRSAASLLVHLIDHDLLARMGLLGSLFTLSDCIQVYPTDSML